MLSFIDAKAVIVQAPNWQPIRTIVEKVHNHPTGLFVSRKSARAMPWEGTGEKPLMMISEVDTDVVRFLAQPHRLEIRLKGRPQPLVYFPDLLREMADGTQQVIEVKKTSKEVYRDRDYEMKLSLAQAVYAALGIEYRIMVTERDIAIDPLYWTAKTIASDNMTDLDAEDRVRIAEALDVARGKLPYAKAVERLSRSLTSTDELAVAKLHALVCLRVVSIDLTARLTRDTPVVRAPRLRASAFGRRG